jgi:hypothetical protein
VAYLVASFVVLGVVLLGRTAPTQLWAPRAD